MVRRLILLALGIALFGAAALAIAFYLLMSGDAVRLALERQATSWLGQPVKIGTATARIFPRPGLTLHDVRAGEPVRSTPAANDIRLDPALCDPR